MAIILASQSPRRQELLRTMGIEDFIVKPSSHEEETDPSVEPGEMVRRIGLGKAKEIALSAGKGDVVIAADTVVYLDRTPLGKPADEADAFRMLKALSGRAHTVYTGVAVLRGEQVVSEAIATEVLFRELKDEEIHAYIASGEPMDKAGAYGIQGKGAMFVEGIEGDYFNVVGLPVCTLAKMLRKVGINI